MMADPRIKQIRIKHGIVKRLYKEKSMYGKEAEREKERLEKMKADGKEKHDILKQEEVIQETLMMIPDCQKRLTTAYKDLKNILETEEDLNEVEEYQAAKELLEEVAPVIA